MFNNNALIKNNNYCTRTK